MKDSNIVRWFEKIAGEEPIECAVLGKHDRLPYDEPAPHPVGKVMSWLEARAILDYEYDSGYGAADCHPVIAWTASKIITITEYDGATGPSWYPRNPIDAIPGFSGISNID
jgi:hypothetical protein